MHTEDGIYPKVTKSLKVQIMYNGSTPGVRQLRRGLAISIRNRTTVAQTRLQLFIATL